ncbi:transcription elongation factor GreA [Kallipyga gabonensis]|uniref:transcription elongation factor GreA n=1 Tax=Kallipyga gabonensis TaxID=1686287 RepID=UPI0006B544F6|nr:transcription elongation factor GreA [Kallipyga gabonensis]
MEQQKNIITRQGYEELKNKLNYLKTVERPKVTEKIKVARGFGDLSENAEYDAAKEEQSKLEGEIQEIESILERSEIFDKDPATSTGEITLGSEVVVLDKEFDEELTLTIKGVTEANPRSNIISLESPLGKALLGHREGETVLVEAPVGKIEYQILKVIS